MFVMMTSQLVFNTENLKLRDVAFAMFHWIGPVNLFCAIVLIAPYRRACADQLLALTCKQQSAATNNTTQTCSYSPSHKQANNDKMSLNTRKKTAAINDKALRL